MIITNSIKTKQSEQRLGLKTLDHMFLKSVEEGANCSRFEAQAILSLVKKIYPIDQPEIDDHTKPGQMKVIGISSTEPCGKPLSKCKMKECTVTIHNGKEDDLIRKNLGVEGLRRAVFLRITTEAYDQGVLLTLEDIAFHILLCGCRTLNRDIAYFKEQNIFVPTRGQKCDIGPGVSHKVKAVELLLQRKNEHEIARILYHTVESIERYTQTFIRVVYLCKQDFHPDDVAFTLHISPRLACQYIELYKLYNNKVNSKILNEIINKYPNIQSDIVDDKKKFIPIYQLTPVRRKL
jgi:hypothetical protein